MRESESARERGGRMRESTIESVREKEGEREGKGG
jgi:hypothetical protein